MHHALCAFLFLWVVLSGSFASASADQISLTLLYTSNTLGEIESGCCPEMGNNGGLTRRSSYIRAVRGEVTRLLVLDGGDALANGLPGNEVERGKARRRAEFILKIYERIGYDGLNIGDTDLALGVDFLKTLQKEFKVSFVSANLKSKKSGSPIFEPFLIKEMDGFKVGILGLLTSEVPPAIAETMEDYFIDDPITVALDLVKGPLAPCDGIIVLAHLNTFEIEALANRIPQSSILIGGNNRTMEFPKQIGRSFHVQTDAYGVHIGRLDLRLVKGSSEFVDILPATLVRRYVNEIEGRLKNTSDPEEKKSLIEMRQILLDQGKKVPETGGKNTFENFMVPLHPAMESDLEIENLISQSKDQLRRPLP